MRGLILLISPFMDWGREISLDLGLCLVQTGHNLIMHPTIDHILKHQQMFSCIIQQSILPCSPFHYFALNQLFEISPMDVPLSFFLNR